VLNVTSGMTLRTLDSKSMPKLMSPRKDGKVCFMPSNNITVTENQQVHGIPVNPPNMIAFLIGKTYNL